MSRSGSFWLVGTATGAASCQRGAAPSKAPMALTVDRSHNGWPRIFGRTISRAPPSHGWPGSSPGASAPGRAFRHGLQAAQVLQVRFRAREVMRRREPPGRATARALSGCFESGDVARQSTDLRALLIGIGDAVTAESHSVEPADFESSKQWAGAQAGRLDSILSGR